MCKTKGVMYTVYDWRLGTNFVWPAMEKKYLLLSVDKMRTFLLINDYGHAAVVAPILRLRLTVQIQEVKYPVKSLKCKSLKYRPKF